MFGGRDLPELRAFAAHSGSHGTVYEVVANHFLVLDARFLALGSTITHAWINARDYWSGQSSTNPIWECVIELPVRIGAQVGTI
jgi:hypothetical protein